jgi:predicted nuclease of predicted toxin-antitoxin system
MVVRFLIDEHVDHAIATALKNRGYDAITLVDANLLGTDDLQAILPYSLAERRVLITRDSEFLALHTSGEAHAGIVHWHGKKRNLKEAIHYLLQLARKEMSDTMLGQVRFVKATYP